MQVNLEKGLQAFLSLESNIATCAALLLLTEAIALQAGLQVAEYREDSLSQDVCDPPEKYRANSDLGLLHYVCKLFGCVSPERTSTD